MMDLIDREALVEELNELYNEQTVSKYSYSRDCKKTRLGIALAINKVKTAPIVEAEPVRHGKIIETIKDGKYHREFSCCGRDFTQLTMWYMPRFCPNCGAKMDGDKK